MEITPKFGSLYLSTFFVFTATQHNETSEKHVVAEDNVG